MKTFLHKDKVEVGCDEAGRGPWAGPLFAAAVILKPGFSHKLIRDSKKLTPNQRKIAREIIKKNAIAWTVSSVSPKVIDKINVQKATMLAVHRCLKKLKTNFDVILMDGNVFKKYKNVQHTCVVKGDSKIYSIAAASILAKTERDEHMIKLSKKHPEYKWNENKGYGTADHTRAILSEGHTVYHRQSFLKNLYRKMKNKKKELEEHNKFSQTVKTALVDVDETICFYKNNIRIYEKAMPSYKNIKKINKLHKDGWNVVYWTSRGSSQPNNPHRMEYIRKLTYDSLKRWGCLFTELQVGDKKPGFDLVIDDKAKRIDEI
tara:strand:- start:360 stop:1313 length:954 start_codon:yes stop_codon:yes gene_type:complete